MRVRSIAAAFAMGIASVGLSLSSAGAEAPAAVVIQAHACAFAPEQVGVWDASGGIEDSGSYVRTFAISAPPDRPPFTLGPFREEFVFTSSQGTFTVMAEERSTEGSLEGVWQIHHGTDAYASASGHGTVDFFFTPVPSCFGNVTFTFQLTGVISKAG